MENSSLFERLGGSTGVRSLVQNIVGMHMENLAFSARSRPISVSPDKLALVKGHLCTVLEAGSREEHERRDVRARGRMNISEADYMVAIDDVLATLKRHVLDEQTQKDVLAIAQALKGQILHV